MLASKSDMIRQREVTNQSTVLHGLQKNSQKYFPFERNRLTRPPGDRGHVAAKMEESLAPKTRFGSSNPLMYISLTELQSPSHHALLPLNVASIILHADSLKLVDDDAYDIFGPTRVFMSGLE